MNKKILPHVIKLLEKERIKINFIDIGSRNGVLELADLGQFIEAYGFEPNPEEYNKLIGGKTDASVKCGVKQTKYKKLSYSPNALSNKQGEEEFFITPGVGAAGLLEPNFDYLRRITYKGKKYQKNFGDDIFSNYKKIKVKTETLDNFVRQNNINYIDYLKIDVEGSECDVLEGGREILKNTGVIKTETCFIPFRKNQKLFSDLDIFLRELGFELLRYEISPAHIGYKEREKPIYYTPIDFSDNFGQLLSCDAIYINRSLDDFKRLIVQATVLLEKNYIDEALYIFKNRTNLKDDEFFNLLKTIQVFGGTLGQKIRGSGYFLIDKLSGLVKKVLRR